MVVEINTLKKLKSFIKDHEGEKAKVSILDNLTDSVLDSGFQIISNSMIKGIKTEAFNYRYIVFNLYEAISRNKNSYKIGRPTMDFKPKSA